MKLDARYQEECDHYSQYLTDSESIQLSESWLRTDTVDAWRHNRMYACLNPLLHAYPDSCWMTVGDGRYGKDAHFIQEKGHRVLATDICSTLPEIALRNGYIKEFSDENAENLSFDDDSFDFVLCKESMHHFPRPMIALYEMLRVAREGVILIEPNDAPRVNCFPTLILRIMKWLLLRCGLVKRERSGNVSVMEPYNDWWEEVGNFGYAISEREIEKVALAMSYEACAFKGLNDYYEKGVEFERADDDSSLFNRVKENIARADLRCRNGFGQHSYGLLVVIIFKNTVSGSVVSLLEQDGYRIKHLPKNPHYA